jgi:hypothetical protein
MAFFAFGCSFTNYSWPTWADMIGKEFESYENWGKSGGGNQFIFNSLMECVVKNKISKDDTVIIMWTNISREDNPKSKPLDDTFKIVFPLIFATISLK